MNKVIGYVLAVVGLAVMVFGMGIFGEVDLFGFDSLYVSGVGVGLVVVGVVLSLMSGGGRVKKQSEEIPIYEGVGKKRKIVGYRKD